ncbi:metal ABC transporter permease [Atopobacter phocae]|uniref:metal ABC transporter permease n=1 Tax=Atopobacter phocae TaxID=136492 RepID=UPI00046FBD60|nr:metal ABC transporter permease [Atopobacter phocae]
MEMFFYSFMQRAFLSATLMGIIAPILGVFLILRRQSLMADTLSHVSLVGIGLGLMVGLNPTWSTLAIVILTAAGIEFVSDRFNGYSEVSIAILMSTGMAVALILMSLISNRTTMTINQFLFGSIIAITEEQVRLLFMLTILTVSAYFIFRRPLYVLIFDPDTAHTAGLPVRLMSTIFTVVTGAVISVLMPIAGALLISAIIVLPGAIALQLTPNFKYVFITGILVSVLGMYGGLIASYQFDTPPGATITVMLALVLVVILIAKLFIGKKWTKL